MHPVRLADAGGADRRRGAAVQSAPARLVGRPVSPRPQARRAPSASWDLPRPGQAISVAAVAYGGFWMRFVAALIDGVLVLIGQSIVLFPIGFAIGLASSDSDVVQALASGVGFIGGVLANWLYEAALTSSSRQATLGKMAMGLKVTDMQGGRISFLQATGRHFAKWASTFTLMIGYLIQPFTERKQALHDMLAGTLVIKKG